MMKSKNPEDFREELSGMERFGSVALRLIMDEALEKWGGDPEFLSELSMFCREKAGDDLFDVNRHDGGLTATWIILYDEIGHYAKNGYSGGALLIAFHRALRGDRGRFSVSFFPSALFRNSYFSFIRM